MEFHDTGLPADPAVCKAFMIYLQNQKRLSPEERGKNHALRVAKLLHETKAGDNNLLAFALLNGMPEAAWTMAEKQFGRDVVKLRKEIMENTKTNLHHIGGASPGAKCFFMAADIIDIETTLTEIKNFGQVLDESDIVQGLEIPQPPEPGVYEDLLAAVHNRTGAPLLEKRYQDAIHKLREDGALPEPTGLGQLDDMYGMSAFPPFENTRLLDHPQVRAAYEIVMADQRTRPEDFSMAVEAAEILSSVPASKSPAAIAATLIDNCIREFSYSDADVWKNSVGPEVVDLLYKRAAPGKRKKVFSDLRQMQLATTIVQMKDFQQEAAEIIDMTDEARRNIDPSVKEVVGSVRDFVSYAQSFSRPLPGTPVSPELERLFIKTLNSLADFVVKNTPKPPKPPKPPKYPGF